MSDDSETRIVNRDFSGVLVPEGGLWFDEPPLTPEQQGAIDEFISTPDPRLAAAREVAKVVGPEAPTFYELNCTGCQVPLMRIGKVETIGPVRTVVALCGVCYDKQAESKAAALSIWARR